MTEIDKAEEIYQKKLQKELVIVREKQDIEIKKWKAMLKKRNLKLLKSVGICRLQLMILVPHESEYL